MKKVVSARFKRSTPLDLASVLGEDRGKKESFGAKALLQSSGLFATMSSI